MISLVVTTFRTDSLYTQACLESIRKWKNDHHELIVVVHDESALLRAYLEACAADGLVDRLVFAERDHGHTRGFNLGVMYANGDVVFNVCNDILIGPSLVDDCAAKLQANPQLGIVGWHWGNEGTIWRDGRIQEYSLRDPQKPDLSAEHERNVRNAPWFTGRYFDAIGGPRWLQHCNTSFFGIRKELLERIGGGFGPEYPHYWADDFLCYAVLDQGCDVRHFDRKFRVRKYFHEFQYDQTDVPDRRRHADLIRYGGAFLDSIDLMDGGMSRDESVFLHLLAHSIPDGSNVTNVGVWRGSSAIVLLDAFKSKRIKFNFIDGFDMSGISAMSAQPPVTQQEFADNIRPYISRGHTVNMVRANTLQLDRFPRSDFIFVDAGHARECITHDAGLAYDCLTSRGVAVFHDYGCPAWPAVKPALDVQFRNLSVYQTLAVHRKNQPVREAYHWPVRQRATCPDVSVHAP